LAVGVSAASGDVDTSDGSTAASHGVPDSISTLESAVDQIKAQSKFAGIALWDVSGAYGRVDGSTNFLQEAGGNVGRHIAEALLATGKHEVTAITRVDSTTTLPEGIKVKKVDYTDHDGLVAALKGQDVLVITLGLMAPPTADEVLTRAAAAAGVPWVLPNDWSCAADDSVLRDVPGLGKVRRAAALVAEAGRSSYISVASGFWYEWSLSMEYGYGFDIVNRAVTFYDNGEAPMSTSSWPQVGRAVAALLSLPVESPPDGAPSLSGYRNKQVIVRSFVVTQKDMFASLLRVTGTTAADWKVTYQASDARYAAGRQMMADGQMRAGYATQLYARLFYPDGSGVFHGKATINAELGLQEEDVDTCTRAAVERAKSAVAA
ncbi:hypothetical protein HK405_004628, partial [Cladochytrium tenue]